MPQKKNNPSNQFVKKPDPQPWNKSRIEIEPAPVPEAPQDSKGRYNDRIKIAPTDEKGNATPRALDNWPEGLKKA